MKKSKIIKILYKNWRGEVAERNIEPIKIWFGSTEWHKQEQWLLKAIDIERNVERDFAIKDILKWLD
jgi:hypothetical protein